MHAWEAIQKTLDSIESNIGKEIQIEELAATAALSVFYYQRLFSRLVKKPVREYIKLRRLARACEALRATDNRILDIALDYGFGSHESFARTFKEAYSMTPTEYRESDVRLNNFDKPDLLLNYTMIDVGVPLISDGLVLEINKITLNGAINFVGVMDYVSITGQFPNGKVTGVSEPGEIWRRFGEVEESIPGRINGRKIGVAYHDTAPEGCFPYFVGKEAFLDWDLSALIALSGEVKGLVAISMKNPTASKITAKLTGLEDFSSDDMADAVGEIVNIIAGNVKKNLEEMFKIIISLPKVIKGMAHMVAIPDDRIRLLCIPFTIYENEVICLSININEK